MCGSCRHLPQEHRSLVHVLNLENAAAEPWSGMTMPYLLTEATGERIRGCRRSRVGAF
jgi:hypothetical protein